MPACLAPCIIPHVEEGEASEGVGDKVTHGDQITVNCSDNYEVSSQHTSCHTSHTSLYPQVNRVGEPIECQNGTWSQIPRCVAARCKTMPTPPHNGMIVAPSLNHGATGLYTCKVGPRASNEGLRIFHNHGEGLPGR